MKTDLTNINKISSGTASGVRGKYPRHRARGAPLSPLLIGRRRRHEGSPKGRRRDVEGTPQWCHLKVHLK